MSNLNQVKSYIKYISTKGIHNTIDKPFNFLLSCHISFTFQKEAQIFINIQIKIFYFVKN